MHIEFRHLRYFVAVAEAGHITRAAEQLGIQQPPLSQQIRSLEAELGVALLRRHPKGVALTEAGQLFHTEATRLLRAHEGMRERMQAFADGSSGTLAVGFTSSAAMHAFTPEALRRCRKEQPGLQLLVSESNAADITEGVAASRLHCGFLRVPVAQPGGLVHETLLQEPAVLAVPRDHPLARGRGVARLHDLQDQPLIFVRRPGAPGLYANLQAQCARQGIAIQVVAEVDRMMTNLNLVAAGTGISVVPASMQGTHRSAIVYRPLAESAGLSAPLTLVYREDSCQGPTAVFVALIRKAATAWVRRHAHEAVGDADEGAP